jgi:hypothetical protein
VVFATLPNRGELEKWILQLSQTAERSKFEISRYKKVGYAICHLF